MEFSFISGSFCLRFFGDKCDKNPFPEWYKAFGTQLPVVQRWLNKCTTSIVLPVFEWQVKSSEPSVPFPQRFFPELQAHQRSRHPRAVRASDWTKTFSVVTHWVGKSKIETRRTHCTASLHTHINTCGVSCAESFASWPPCFHRNMETTCSLGTSRVLELFVTAFHYLVERLALVPGWVCLPRKQGEWNAPNYPTIWDCLCFCHIYKYTHNVTIDCWVLHLYVHVYYVGMCT